MMKAREDPDKVRERKNIILSQKGSHDFYHNDAKKSSLK